MTHIDTSIHPKISRYTASRPSSTVIAQLAQFCGRIEITNFYSLRQKGWITRIDMYAFRDLRNLFMVDILLADARVKAWSQFIFAKSTLVQVLSLLVLCTILLVLLIAPAFMWSPCLNTSTVLQQRTTINQQLHCFWCPIQNLCENGKYCEHVAFYIS